MFSDRSSNPPFDLCAADRNLSSGFEKAIKGDINDPRLLDLAIKMFEPGQFGDSKRYNMFSGLKDKMDRGEITQEQHDSFLEKVIKEQHNFKLIMRSVDSSLNSEHPYDYQSDLDQWFPNQFDDTRVLAEQIIKKEISKKLEKLKAVTGK